MKNIKEEIISFRAGTKTRENIESIKKQMIERGINYEPNDSYVIRHAISTLNEKMKYFLYQADIDKNKKGD